MSTTQIDLTFFAGDPSLDIEILLNGVLVQHPDFAVGYRVGLERYHTENEYDHDPTYPWTSADVIAVFRQACTDTEHSEAWRTGLIFGWISTHLHVRASQCQIEGAGG